MRTPFVRPALLAALAALASCAEPEEPPEDTAADEAALTVPVMGGDDTTTMPPPLVACSPGGGCWTSSEGLSLHAEPALAAYGDGLEAALSATNEATGPAAEWRSRGARAVRATTGGAGDVAVDVQVLHQEGETTGARVQARSGGGAAVELLHTGAAAGSRLLAAYANPYAAPVFAVQADGDVVAKGAVVPEFGPEGPKGDRGEPGATGATGGKGAKGSRGDTGDPGASTSDGAPISVCRLGASTCTGLCPNATITSTAKSVNGSGCTANGGSGCYIGSGFSGVCCVCDP